MSATPSHGRRALDDEELLALARNLPEPALSGERQEEMRTAFLSTVRGVKSGVRPRATALLRRRRLILIGTVVVACAGMAAASWRLGTSGHRRYGQRIQDDAVSVGRVPQVSPPRPSSPSPAEQPASSPRPSRAVTVNHPRKDFLSFHKAADDRGGAGGVEVAFARGWSSLRTGDFNTAAQWFERAASGQDNALAEDALFWQGAALDRAGRFATAHQVLKDFLARYPDSDRSGEASVILGWLLMRSGEFGEARRHFQRASDDPAERVRNSAQAGLIAAERQIREPATESPIAP